jgi:Cu+-exporting ATPase
MKLFLIGLLALGAVSGVACHAPTADERATETIVLSIEGMTCPLNCPPRVVAALRAVPGVRSAAVNYDERKAIVTCDGNCRPADLVKALEATEFRGSVLSGPPSPAGG